MRDSETEASAGRAWFATTHWNLVQQACDSSPAAREALDTLCRAYWEPLYVFIRRQGYGAHDAQDLTQAFLVWLIRSRHLRVADPQRGKFRSFLLVRLKHFLGDERKKRAAQRRGGTRQILSLDALAEEEERFSEPAVAKTPDEAFDRRWAIVLFERVMDQLRTECMAAGHAALFEHLKRSGTGRSSEPGYSKLAGELGLTESAVKSSIFRLRRRQGELLRQEIAHTVTSRSEIDDELRYLIEVLSR